MVVTLCKSRAALPRVKEHSHIGQGKADLLHTPDELGAEDQYIGLGQLQAVFDLLGSIPEIERHHDGAGL
ncbi:hypothetical protein SDC9_182126 [bioreactor metagenome]|uniref:Uncharacterized protein n=1 Tax=bioreactor metagenome TaxID=1076179 RepID=A0A645H8E1_9ZZZZ